MSDLTIACPNCGTTIPLDETLAGPLVAETRKSYEARLSAAEAHAKVHEAKALSAAKLAAQAELAALNSKLADAQKAQADFVRQSRELADKQRELDLTIEKRVSEMSASLQAKARSEAESGVALKLAEKDKQLADAQRQLEETQRKLQQGSQQLQGEVLELQLETLLTARFPTDRFEPVAKGVFGADLIQHVLTPAAQACGAILWETKRTRNWTEGWLAKLRTDQREARAEIAVLLSEALPKGVATFDLIDGIWVAHTRYAEPLGLILRQSLIDMQANRVAQAGQETKTELVYAYLTGPRFRHRIEAIVERFTEMQADLVRERTAMQKLWARREQQISAVIGSTVGMYGDLQGIAGQAIADIPMLELPGTEGT